MQAPLPKISSAQALLEGRRGQSYVIADINYLLGEEGSAKIEGAVRRAGGSGAALFPGGEKGLVFQYQGARDVRAVGSGAFRKTRGGDCWAGWSTVLLLISEDQYEQVGGDLGEVERAAQENNAVFVVLEEDGLLTVSKAGFAFAGQKIC